MKLHEKIYYCRKKSGMSQETLAEKIGVSRQAISKWETGDAVPELSKLKSLCDIFGVTADWMISEDEPDETPKKEAVAYSDRISRFDDLTDKIADGAEKIFKKHAWICGIAVILIGVYRVISAIMPLFTAGGYMPDGFIFFSFFYALIGFVFIIGGIILTVVLKKWCKKNNI